MKFLSAQFPLVLKTEPLVDCAKGTEPSYIVLTDSFTCREQKIID